MNTRSPVHIDTESCTATGVCEQLLPSVFTVVDDIVVAVDHDAAANTPADDLRKAARGCPWGVISIETD